MAMSAQGTNIFVIDPADGSVLTIGCATSFNPGGSPASQLATTCLEDNDASFIPGMREPGQATLTISADPRDPSHVRLYELFSQNPSPVLKWAVGWPDGPNTPPTADVSGDFVLPTTRTWYLFQGYIVDFPFDHALNAVITATIPIQRSGGSSWIAKV